MLLLVTGPVLSVPLVGLLPVQPPEAVQEVALVEDQVRVDVEPMPTLVALVLIVTVGGALSTGGGGLDVPALAGAPPPPHPNRTDTATICTRADRDGGLKTRIA